MKVALTGGTGFIGAHTLVELRRRGHDVRLLVRNPDKAARTLEMFGLQDDSGIECAKADLADHAALRAGLDGVEAVVHVAALFSLDPNDAARMAELNPSSTEAILSAGRELGLDPMVYVSTMGVYVPAPARAVSAETDISTGCGPYTFSKVSAEHIARRHQAEGAPVTCVYPGAVFGPNDPNPQLSDSVAVLRDLLQGKVPGMPNGASLPVVDVRDVASVCAGSVDRAQGPRRYLVPGRNTRITDLVDEIVKVTGREIRLMNIPPAVMRIAGPLMDGFAKLTGKKMALSKEAVAMVLQGIEDFDVEYDGSPAQTDFGLPGYSIAETVGDTIRWLASSGHLSAAQAGSAAT